jgi:hypothetical protein
MQIPTRDLQCTKPSRTTEFPCRAGLGASFTHRELWVVIRKRLADRGYGMMSLAHSHVVRWGLPFEGSSLGVTCTLYARDRARGERNLERCVRRSEVSLA